MSTETLPARASHNGSPARPMQMTVQDMRVIAEEVHASGLYPGITTPQAAFTLMMLCQAEGLHPMTALKRYHIIEGRPSMRADTMQAEFQARGGKIRWLRWDADEARAEFSHATHHPEPIEIAVTYEEMKAAGITSGKYGEKQNWKAHRGAMLRARLISRGVRMIDPSGVVGIYTPEEVADFAPGQIAPEVIDVEARPPQPRTNNNSGHGKGWYASEDQAEAYRKGVEEFVAKTNDAWLDRWMTETHGDVPSSIQPLLNVWQLDNHLVKWAKQEGLLEVGSDHEQGVPARLIGRYTAILWFRSKKDKRLLWDEMQRYVAELAERSARAVYRKHPELAPPGDESQEDGGEEWEEGQLGEDEPAEEPRTREPGEDDE